MHALDVATALGGGLIAAGFFLFYLGEPEAPRAILATAAGLLCPLALVRLSSRSS